MTKLTGNPEYYHSYKYPVAAIADYSAPEGEIWVALPYSYQGRAVETLLICAPATLAEAQELARKHAIVRSSPLYKAMSEN